MENSLSLEETKILQFLTKCQKEYYNGTPIITDEEFDNLAARYNFYEVGIAPEINTRPHTFRMYSLEKFYEEDGVKYPKVSLVKTPKLDGSAISLLYVKGNLVEALTRGDGYIGEDITDKMLAFPRVPNKIRDLSTRQITGEVVAKSSIENARNYASGALNLKDINEFLSRELNFIAYGLQPYVTESYYSDMEILQNERFRTVIDSQWLEYPQDGIVYRIDSNEKFVQAGYTSKHPKGAFAVKKRSDVATLPTVLRDVTWQLGKGGKITPVAHFDTIVIEDANISKATLHNAGFIEEWDLHIGDRILITRSGGIIPKVVGKE